MAAEISPGIERSSDLKMNGIDEVEVCPCQKRPDARMPSPVLPG